MDSSLKSIPFYNEQLDSVHFQGFGPDEIKSSELHVQIDAGAERVFLFDMSGRIVLQDNHPVATEGLYNLSLSGIAAGTYILRIESADACTDQQIVVSAQ